MKIFKIEAEGDVVYIRADDQDSARIRLTAAMGPIPESLLTWTEVKKLPPGEEYL